MGARFRWRRVVAAAGFAVLLGIPSTASAATVGVDVNDNFYSPTSVSIGVGDQVTWTWKGVASHTVTSDDGGATFASGAPKNAGTFDHTFSSAGEFTYHCLVHGASMSGKVIVGSELDFSDSAYSVGEGDGSATITVSRAGSLSGQVSVTYNTTDGTATAGQDYTDVSGGTLTWNDGVGGDKSFQVPITDAATPESDETVNLSLSNPQGGAFIGTGGTATLTILDKTYQPDVLVKGPANSSYKGNGLYNTLVGQTTLAKVAKGKSAKFYVKFQNDGTDNDDFAIKGKHGNTDFSVLYFRGTAPITKDVVAGAKETPSLAPGASWTIRVVIAPKRAASVGDVFADVVSALSNNNLVKKDAVQLKEKVVSAS